MEPGGEDERTGRDETRRDEKPGWTMCGLTISSRRSTCLPALAGRTESQLSRVESSRLVNDE